MKKNEDGETIFVKLDGTNGPLIQCERKELMSDEGIPSSSGAASRGSSSSQAKITRPPSTLDSKPVAQTHVDAENDTHDVDELRSDMETLDNLDVPK